MAIDQHLESFHFETVPATEEEVITAKEPCSWWKRGMLAVGIAAVGSVLAVVAFSGTEEDAPKLTHRVARGDLVVSVRAHGSLESSENVKIKCKVRGRNTILWVIPNGTSVQPGDELLRMDSLFIQEQINERTKYAHWSRSAAERSAADVARSKLAVAEYEKGRFVKNVMTLEKDLAIAEAKLLSARNVLEYKTMMARRGYTSNLEVEQKEFALKQAELDVKLKRNELSVLKEYSKAEQSETLRGNFAAVSATHKANAERAIADASRRDRAVEESKHCVIRADRAGVVVYPTAPPWKRAPEIVEGATTYKNQVLLLMPNLSKMQVKTGIHESEIKRVKKGLKAIVTVPGRALEGTVSSVATVTRPPSEWNGNVIKYDTLVRLPPEDGLNPGMSAEVEIIIAKHTNVLSVPVAAVVETEQGAFCWVKTPEGVQRRLVETGDTNTVHTIVKRGLIEGDEVVLNPPRSQVAQKRAQAHEEPKPDGSQPK